MATGLEIERKFKVDRKKFFAELRVNSELLHAYNTSVLISQFYILDSKGVELRVREIDPDDDDSTRAYFMTSKKTTEQSYVRVENEVEIQEDAFELLKDMSYKGLTKLRAVTRINAIKWYIDVYFGDALKDLVIAEVEFENIEEADKLTDLPTWVEREITDCAEFKNASLAIPGWGVAEPSTDNQ